MALGCGTTRWSDTSRTATEQMLISDAVDRAVSDIDLSALANRTVYLETKYLPDVPDQKYVISTLRQHMLASGCIIKDKPEDAGYIVEVRTGSVGTNRQDLLFGVPSTNVPTVGLLPTGTATIPEIALMKRTNQQGVCRIAVFAYERASGRPVWQSGTRQVASRAKDIWLMGAGPFQKGTIYNGTSFAGERLGFSLPKEKKNKEKDAHLRPKSIVVGDEVVFPEAAPRSQLASGLAEPPPYSSGLPIGYGVAAVPQASGNNRASYAAPLTGVDPFVDVPATAAPPALAPAPTAPSSKDPPASPNSSPPQAAAPAPMGTGLQGPLSQQTIATPPNPAAATAGVLQMSAWARALRERE
jgi:hypothetical protein